MKLIPKLLTHFIFIIVVMLLPVIVFEYMTSHDYNGFAFIGGITYFIYALYLVLRIKNHRSKIIALGVLSFLLAMCIGMILIDINEFVLLITVLINLIIQTFLLIKNPKSKNKTTWKTYLINFVVALILSFFGAFIWLLLMAASGMPSNHY